MHSASKNAPVNLFDAIPQLEKDWVYIVESCEDMGILRELGLEGIKLPHFQAEEEVFPAFSHLTNTGKSIALVAGNRFRLSEFSENICHALFSTGRDFRILNLSTFANGNVRSLADWVTWTHETTKDGRIGELATFGRQSKPWISTTDWVKPTPIKTRSLELPEFPVDCLPDKFGDAVRTITAAFQLPPGLGGSVVLGIMALACQGKFVVSPREDWVEEVSLYVVASAPSGSGKSIVFKTLLEPVNDFEMIRQRDTEMERCKIKARRGILEGRLKNARKSAFDGDETAQEDVLSIMKELVQLEDIPTCELYTSNATPEAVTEQLCLHHGRYSLFTSEGGEFFDILGGRYSNNGKCNIDIFLKADSGESIRTHRVGQNGKPLILEEGHLTIALCVQPLVLEKAFQVREFVKRGLMGRFLMCDLPSPFGSRDMNPPLMDRQVMGNYSSKVQELLAFCSQLEANRVDKTLIFDDNAYARFTDFRQRIEEGLGTFGQYRGITECASKLPGRVARVAGLLHIADLFQNSDPAKIPVCQTTVERAIAIGEYYLAHALALEGNIKKTPVEELTNTAVGLIRRKGLCRIKAKDLYYPLHKTRNEIEPVLEELEKKGLIRKMKPKTAGKTGRPEGDVWAVNPYIHTDIVTSVYKITGAENG